MIRDLLTCAACVVLAAGAALNLFAAWLWVVS